MANCLEVVEKANAGRVSDADVEIIFERLERKKRRAINKLDDVEAVMFLEGGRLADDAVLKSAIEERNALRNAIVFSDIMDMAKRADASVGDPSLGLEAALVGVNTQIKGGNLRSVAALTEGYVAADVGGMAVDMTRAGVFKQFQRMTGDLAKDVGRVLYDLNSPVRDPNLKASKDAKAIAAIMHKYQSNAVARENRKGAYIRHKSGYVTRQAHTPALLARAGQDAWTADVKKAIDWEKMDVSPADREEFLEELFKDLRSGVRTTSNDIDVAFKGSGNLAKKESQSRVIEFKDYDAWFDYNAKYGRADLREAFMGDMMQRARATALLERLGANPEAMVDRVMTHLRETYRGDPKKLKRINREGFNALSLEAALAEVTGSVNHIGTASRIPEWTAGFRALQTMAKLGGAWISALSDVAFKASARTYNNRSVAGAWHDALSSTIEGIAPGQKREISQMIGVGLEGMLGDFMSRFNAQDTMPGRTSKLMGLYFKMNILGPWTDANKRGVGLMIARDLANEAGMKFGELPPASRRMLEIYGIDAKQWEVARHAVKEGPDGRSYLIPGEVADVRGAMFTGMTQQQQVRLRDDVQANLFALLSSEVDFAVPSPGARERAVLRRGYKPGTLAGEAIRFVAQFKSFSVVSMTKVLGRHMYGNLPGETKKILGMNQGTVHAIVASSVMGYFVYQLKELSKGREMRPLSPETVLAGMAQGGGLGLYGDFLFGQYNRFGGGPLTSALGPAISTADDVFNLALRLRDASLGGEGDVRGDIINLLKSNIPFANLFYLKSALDYMIWYQLQEMVNPGYLQRMERRVKSQNNQGFWMPPSSIVARGGGFR